MNFTGNQLEAINHREGNLKIVACAGSGKTTVMAERIAKLIRGGVDRDKIVAITYTKKAAASLKFTIREKLETYCSDSPHLGGMFIGTIHAFAFQKLKEILPKYRSYELLDEVTRIIWLQKHYRDLDLDQIATDRRYFDKIQRFLRTADVIRDNEIPDDKLGVIPDFMEIYEKYIDRMDSEKYLDFSGIIIKLVEVVSSNEGLLNELRDSVHYLVVDEYQDINPIQERLVSLIVGESGNLCVVGDDDQSIFEFQGADVNNIIEFEDRYNDVNVVKLEENFRCPAEVIEAARNLIKRNSNRIDKSMIPGEINEVVNTSQRGDIYKVEFDTIGEEVDFILRKIEEIRCCEYDEEGFSRGLDYGDIAIIVRTKLSAQRLIEPLRSAGIPFTFKGTGGLFQRPEIEFIRLSFCYFADVSPGRDENKRSIPPTLEMLEDYFVNRLNIEHIDWNYLSTELNNLKEYIDSISSHNPNASRRRIFLQEFFYKFAEVMKISADNYSDDILYDFGRFSKLIAQFESIHGWINKYYFKQFVYFINGYAQRKTDEGGLDDPRTKNSVNILTVHQAKGLEYPAVFIPDVSIRRFPSQNRNRKPATHLSDSIFDLRKYCSGDEGERRLFYVAATRTKKFLFITRSNQSDTGNNANRSHYFTEFDHEIMLLNDVQDPTERRQAEPQCKPDLELIPTSFTDLRHYISCPYSYLLQQMMGFSPILNLAYGYGLQVHNLLNHVHKKWDQEAPDLEELESLIESEFFLRFTRGQPYENMKNKAKDILKSYAEDYGHEFPLKLETEKPFEFTLGGALISGQIDLIQNIDPESHEIKDVCLIDFKTEREKLETKDLIRLQLRLYALAGDKSLGLNPQEAKIHYLSDKHREEIDISEKKLDETRDRVSEIIEGIKNNQFEPCLGKNCETCDVRFVCNSRQL